jgi:hypothetical protein
VRGLLAISVLVALAAPASANDGAMQCDARGCRPVATHKTGDIAMDIGAGTQKTWLQHPHDTASPLLIDLNAGMVVYASPVFAVGLRGHVTIGRGPTTITSLAADLRRDRGGLFFAASPGIAKVRGPDETDALAAVVELRAGLDLGSAQVALAATPLYAFANDSFMPGSAMGVGILVGANVSLELR